MAIVAPRSHAARMTNDWRATATTEDLIVEGWGQGFVVGALIIMTCITVSNMRRGILLCVQPVQNFQRRCNDHFQTQIDSRRGMGQQESNSLAYLLIFDVVAACYVARHILFYGLQGLRMVSFEYRRFALHLIVDAQLGCLAQDPTIFQRQQRHLLHLNE